MLCDTSIFSYVYLSNFKKINLNENLKNGKLKKMNKHLERINLT